MSNEAAGPWPSWDELFGGPPDATPPPGGSNPFPSPSEIPSYLTDRFGNTRGSYLTDRFGNTRGANDKLGWNVGGQPERGPAPNPAMAPEGMVANPYYYLPGNAAYIPQGQYDELMQVAAGPQYDAYDAMYQTPGNDRYMDPETSAYNPGKAWQRENDYYDALAARGELSRATAGNYVTSTRRTRGRDIVEVRPIPYQYDMRQGEYYQPDGTIADAGNRYSPADSLFFGISNAEKKYIPANMSYVDYLLSTDINRSQPRANALGDQSLTGAPGGVVGPGDPAYDYLRGVTPAVLSNGAIDPNPFRGPVGTSTSFIAEQGDDPSMYPGVSFYEATKDGGMKKVTSFSPDKTYYAVRENYDFEGFAENPTMKNADPGTVFQVRTGNSEKGTSVSSFGDSYNILSVYDPATKQKYTVAEIEAGDHGGEPGVIPGGWGVMLSKTGTPVEEAILGGEDRMGVAAAAYNMEGPESVAAMMKTGVGQRFTDAGFVVGDDGLLVRAAQETPAQEQPADSTTTPQSTTPAAQPAASGATSAEDFNAQMKTYIGGSLRAVTEGRVTFVPGEKGSSYPSYVGTDYEDIGGKGWIVPVAPSTAGASVAELKNLGATVYKNNGIDKKTGLIDWVAVSSGEIKEGVQYVMVFTNGEIRTILGV